MNDRIVVGDLSCNNKLNRILTKSFVLYCFVHFNKYIKKPSFTPDACIEKENTRVHERRIHISEIIYITSNTIINGWVTMTLAKLNNTQEKRSPYDQQ